MREKTEIIADVKAVFSEIRGYADQMRGFPVDPLTAVLSQKPELKARFEALMTEAEAAGITDADLQETP
jgi:hypothetical protein